jgi:gliding motility-associated-like protein
MAYLRSKIPLVFSAFFFLFESFAQNPEVDFLLPDTVCVNTPVAVTNLTQNGSTFYWNFCQGNANLDPVGKNLGNPSGVLSVPTYMTLAKQDDECFGFVSCQGLPGIARIQFGSSFRNDPQSAASLGSFGVLTDDVEGIQILKDNGNWYGFINNNTTIIRLDFGTSLWKTPVVTDIGPFPQMVMGHSLTIVKEGDTWIGFATCTSISDMLRFNFGSSLTNIPTCESFGNIAGFDNPNQIALFYDNDTWYLFVANGLNDTFSRIVFGNSLLNAPAGENLGNPGGFLLVLGLVLKSDCGRPTGYFSEYLTDGRIGKINFPAGPGGSVNSFVLGNIGSLNRPHSFSEIFRVDDTLYAYLLNRGDGTLTRYNFPPCSNAVFPSSTLFTPPPMTFSQTGTFTVHLIVNEGMPNQASLCKQVVIVGVHEPAFIDTTLCYGIPYYAGGAWQTTPGIYYDTIHYGGNCDSVIRTTLNYKPEIPVFLGNDTTICKGWPYILHTGVPAVSCYWQDGSTDSTYAVSEPGTYWVVVTKNGCSASDTIRFGECSSSIWFPNVFTPNGDGLNDTYHPVGIGITKFSIIIYNRWGMKLYESDNMELGWDGSFGGGSCPDGVYVFISTYEMEESPGITQKAHGSITLIR